MSRGNYMSGRIRRRKRRSLVRRFGERCAICGIEGVRLTIDHIKKKRDGGSNKIENLRLICDNCDEDR